MGRIKKVDDEGECTIFQRAAVGRGVPGRGGQGRGERHVQAHKRGALRVPLARARVRGEHADGDPVLHVDLHVHGPVLGGDVHDDRLGAQQALARPPRQCVRRHGHRRRLRPVLLPRRRLHRHQPRRSFPHDRSVTPHLFFFFPL